MVKGKRRILISRRRVLGSILTVGTAGALGGAATSALLWDEERFGNATDPNLLRAGKLDLKVDWQSRYYNWINDDGDGEVDEPGETTGPGVRLLDGTSDTNGDGGRDLVDEPGPLVKLEDVKPGDILSVTLGAHIFGNPAFLSLTYEEHADVEAAVPDSERSAHAQTGSDDLDPDGGELDEYINCVIWHDDGDGLPGEVWTGDADIGDGDGDGDEETSTDTLESTETDSRRTYASEIASATEPADIVAETDDQLIFAGVLADLGPSTRHVLDSTRAIAGSSSGHDFRNTARPKCYTNSKTEYIGILCWLPRDIPGVNDNIIQADGLEFELGFDAIQCRNNVADDGGPIDGNLPAADGHSDTG